MSETPIEKTVEEAPVESPLSMERETIKEKIVRVNKEITTILERENLNFKVEMIPQLGLVEKDNEDNQ